VIAAAPVSDTVKEVGDDGLTVVRTLERSRLWAVQTPQVFRRSALDAAFAGASDDLLAAATDDAWLIERSGGTVRVLDAGPRNLKVTTPTDLQLAEMLLSDWA
jgi:2-C-methyl-D-erythritol 4-phosphate cytidylyltransferase